MITFIYVRAEINDSKMWRQVVLLILVKSHTNIGKLVMLMLAVLAVLVSLLQLHYAYNTL